MHKFRIFSLVCCCCSSCPSKNYKKPHFYRFQSTIPQGSFELFKKMSLKSVSKFHANHIDLPYSVVTKVKNAVRMDKFETLKQYFCLANRHKKISHHFHIICGVSQKNLVFRLSAMLDLPFYLATKVHKVAISEIVILFIT